MVKTWMQPREEQMGGGGGGGWAGGRTVCSADGCTSYMKYILPFCLSTVFSILMMFFFTRLQPKQRSGVQRRSAEFSV